MSPFKKKFAKKYAKELLSVAVGDLRTARVLLDHPEGRPENTFFHVHQVVEKSIKAVLCHKGEPVPLIHDLAALMSMLPDAVPTPPDAKALTLLTEFASVRRYEEGNYEYTAQEGEAIYKSALELLKWAQAIVQP